MLMTGIENDCGVNYLCNSLESDGMHFPYTKINCNRLTEGKRRYVETLKQFE
jgi:hypothetical protein